MHRKLTQGLLLALAGLGCTPALAATSLTGATFSAAYYFPDSSTPYSMGSFSPPTFVVGAGVETVGNIEDVTFLATDFGATSLAIDFTTQLASPTFLSTSFNGPIFTAATPHDIAGFSINGATTLSGFTADRVTITANDIQLNFQGLSYNSDSYVALDFRFAGTTTVPEPASWALMILGFGLVGAALRLSRRSREGAAARPSGYAAA